MKVLIADDHPMVRDALSRTVASFTNDVAVIECDDLAQTEQALAAQDATLLLLDLHMPGMHGAETVQRLRHRHPGVRIVVASGDDAPAVVRAVIAAGAAGFLPKRERAEVIRQALRLVLDGGTYLPSQALADVAFDKPATRPDSTALTPRQLDVLHCLMRGDPNKVIARQLGLTEGTVKIHIAAILRALRVRNRTEAVVVARGMGVGEPS